MMVQSGCSLKLQTISKAERASGAVKTVSRVRPGDGGGHPPGSRVCSQRGRVPLRVKAAVLTEG